MTQITIYYPEGGEAYTANVEGHEIESHIAGPSMYADEAVALEAFNAHSEAGVPQTLLGVKRGDPTYILVEEGVEDGVPFARYKEKDET